MTNTGAGAARSAQPLQVLHLISSLHVGGAGRLMLRNVQLLRARGVEGHVCYVTTRSDLVERFTEAGFPPVCLEHRSRLDWPRTLRRLVRLVKQLEVDVIHANLALDGNLARVAGALTRVPVVATLHDADKPPPIERGTDFPTVRVKTLVEDALARVSTRHFLAVSKAVKEHYVGNHWVPRSRAEVIHPPLDHDVLEAQMDPASVQRVRAELGLDGRYPVLLNVARLHPIKDQLGLVASMQHLRQRCPDARLLIAGDGEMRAELEALIDSGGLADHVTLLGQRSDVPALLGASDVFVLSSRSEGLPGSILEAMAAAKPVVATRVGGVPEVVVDGVTGHLVPAGAPPAFADAVAQIAGLPDRGRAMGLAGRQRVRQHFRPEASVEKLEAFYLRSARRGNARSSRPTHAAEEAGTPLTPKRLMMRSLWVMQGSALARRLHGEPVRVLTYHGFTDAGRDSFAGAFNLHVDAFRSQLLHLVRHYNIVPLTDVVEHVKEGRPLPPRPAVITIDDGYESVYTLAFPALLEAQAPATVFPALDFVDGRTVMWTDRVKACVAAAGGQTVIDVKTGEGKVTLELGAGERRAQARRIVNLLLGLGDAEREAALSSMEDAVAPGRSEVSLEGFRPMSWTALDEMVQSGLVTVGSHTRSHAMATSLPDRALQVELAESKRTIESRLGVSCDLFCYPYGGVGAFDERTARLVREAGYRCALTTLPGMVTKGDDPYQLRRLGPSEDPLSFDFAMSGFSRMLSDFKQSVRRRGSQLRA
jgi:glycosyltransferase involved in cell wall biosynthesis/peptidoglycan/xylan/chitin deacetylase (PgdA/CDA1 family)